MPPRLSRSRVASLAVALGAVLGAGHARAQSLPGDDAQTVTLQDALELTAVGSPDIALASGRVAAERAGLRAAASAFEPRWTGTVESGQTQAPLTAAQRAGVGGPTLGTGYSAYEVGLAKQFRSGLEVSPFLRVTRTETDGVVPFVETTAAAALSYSVLGGARRSLENARERAASLQVEAAQADFLRSRELALGGAARAYWEYVGAVKVAEALEGAETRVSRLLGDTRKLVQADERPSADLIPLRADLLRRRASRLRAEMEAREARRQLGLAMGMASAQADALGEPGDALPTTPPDFAIDERALVAAALAARADLFAAERRLVGAEREVNARRTDLRPAIDVVVEGGYSGLSEGGVGPQHYVPAGLNTVGGGFVNVKLRVNRLRSGASRAAFEAYEVERIRLRVARDDLARRIEAEVIAAVAEQRSGASQVAHTRAAVLLYEQAVEVQRQRLWQSMGTLFDVQIAEERLADAQTEAVRAEVRHASSLVRLHLAVGTLLRDGLEPAARLLGDLEALGTFAAPFAPRPDGPDAPGALPSTLGRTP